MLTFGGWWLLDLLVCKYRAVLCAVCRVLCAGVACWLLVGMGFGYTDCNVLSAFKFQHGFTALVILSVLLLCFIVC